ARTAPSRQTAAAMGMVDRLPNRRPLAVLLGLVSNACELSWQGQSVSAQRPRTYFVLEGNSTMVTLLAHRTDRKSKEAKPRLEGLEERSLMAAAVPGVTLDPATIPKFVNTLDPKTLALGNHNFVYKPRGTARVTLESGARARVPLYHVGVYQIQQDLGLGL